MNRRIMLFLALIILNSIFLCGCNMKNKAKRELNTLGIVVGIAIDASENKDEIELTAQIVRNESVGQNASGKGSSAASDKGDVGKAYWNISTTGENLLEAMRSAIYITNRDLYIAQNHIVIISQELAQKGIGEYLDYFFRDQNTRYDVSIVISEGRAADVLNIDSHLDKLPAQDLYKMIETQSEKGVSFDCTLFDFAQNNKIPYKSNIVPVVSIVKPKDEENKSPYLYISGSAIFNENEMALVIDKELTNGLMWLSKKKTGGSISVEYKKDNCAVEILECINDFKVSYSNEEMKIKAIVEVECKLGEYQSANNITESILEDIEALCAAKINDEVIKSLEVTRQKQADVLGIAEYLYRYNYCNWKYIQENFMELYKAAKIETEVNVDILRTGALLEEIDG